MIKIVTLSEDDITTDPEGAADALMKSLERKTLMRFSGLCPIGKSVLFVFEETLERDTTERFVFSELPDATFEGVTAAVQIRYEGGFSTLGTFFIGDRLWGLFRK